MDAVFEANEAKAYEAWLESRNGRHYLRATTGLLDRLLDCQPGWRVLDVGCGLGLHLEHLRERRQVLAHGLEAGPVMVRMASQRLGDRVEVDKGDAHDLPYEDNEFDAVIMVNTLESIERRAQALAEAVRVAASRVLMISFNFWSPGYHIWRMRGEANPFKQARPMGIMGMSRLIREVLGPVPKSWAGANLWPNLGVGIKPLAALTGICAAVTPRFRTRGLIVKAGHAAKRARPASAVPAASSSSHITLLPPKNT